jgi:Fur family peroxide stress response transcriptional regulator
MNQQRPQEQFSRFQANCRREGLKLTHQRLEIYRELVISTDHPTAETLYQGLIRRIPTLSLDTIYRTLATFARHGLVHKVETGESQARFEVITERHDHLICRHCFEIRDFNCPSMDEVALPEELRTWGQIENKNVVAYGVCRKCMNRSGLTSKYRGNDFCSSNSYHI